MAEKKLKTVAELAELLSISDKTVYRQCKAGNFPHHRIGGSYRFSETDVLAILRTTHVDVTSDEITPVGRRR